MKNKVILITGGAGGIGLEVVRLLSAQGAQVVVVDKDKVGLSQLAAQIPMCETICCDVAQIDDLPQLIDGIAASKGHIDILINNAGVGFHGPIAEQDPALVDYVMRVNATAPTVLMRAVLPYMATGGVILNVGSPVAAYLSPGFSVYSGSKNALKSITRIGRKELKPRGIRVILFYPFITWSDYAKNAIYTPSFAPWTKQNVPAWPDTASYAARKLIAAISSTKSVVKARPDWYFMYALIKQKLR